MAHKIQRAGFISALILSLFAIQSGAYGKSAAPAETKPSVKAASQKTPAVKRVGAKKVPPKVAAKTRAAKKGALKPAVQKPLLAAAAAPKSSTPQIDVKPPSSAGFDTAVPAQDVLPANAPPGCVANLVDADFQTLPVVALEGLNRRLEALGLTRTEADNSVRTLTERAGGMVAGGSVIVARYVDSCDPRRVQVISVSLALDGPTSFTWLRGADAPAVIVAEATAPVSEPVVSTPMISASAVSAPGAIGDAADATDRAAPIPTEPALTPAPAPVAPPVAPPVVAAVEPAPIPPAGPMPSEPPVALAAIPEASPSVPPPEPLDTATIEPAPEPAATGVTVAGFSIGSFSTKPEASRQGFTDELPAEAPLGFHLRVAGQVTEGDLGPALSAAGLPSTVVQQVLDSFAADGKVPLALAENLSFDVLYRTAVDTMADPVLTSAELSHGGQSRRLYYYVPEEGTAHLIDQDGKVRLAQGPDFIHPLPGQRMTSGFGWRMHPVLRARKFHKGVDWSAPRGTPVVAAGDGIVDTVKFHRGYGKYIRIVHDARTETVYAHLDQFAKGIKVGHAVRQGQVIGTVGRTGIASGNHLYFELVVDGRHIDPLRNVPALVQDLLAEGKDKEDQQRFVSFADTLLQSVPATASASDRPSGYRTARTEPAPGDIP